MSSFVPYAIANDPVLQMLISEATADIDVIGLVLSGSRAVELVTPESDYDIYFVVTDEAIARYKEQGLPRRGHTVDPPIETTDLFNEPIGWFQRESLPAWTMPTWAEACILYDRDGATARAFEALRYMTENEAAAQAAEWYDTYLNALYRSLKAWRRGNMLGGRLEAVESIDALLRTLYALERRWRPYSDHLVAHLDELAGQGWAEDEVRSYLLSLAGTGDPVIQQQLARRVIALVRDRGFDRVMHEWHGQIEQALAWTFM